MFGFLDDVEELSEVDKKGSRKLPLFCFICCSLCSEKNVLETNIWFGVIRIQLLMGLVELLK